MQPTFIPLDAVSTRPFDLDSIQIAAPCRASWNAMQGNDTARFCQTCAKNVYNLSAMTQLEAQSLIRDKEGKLCIRFFQREDGTLLTRDCPVGAAAQKQTPAFALWASVMSLVVVLGALGSPSFLASASAQPDNQPGKTPLQSPNPAPAMMGDFDFVSSAPPAPPATMGEAQVQTAPAKPQKPATQPVPPHHLMGRISVRPHAKPRLPAAPMPKKTSASSAKGSKPKSSKTGNSNRAPRKPT